MRVCAVTRRYFNPKSGNRKLFSQALQLFLQAVSCLMKHCAERFKMEARFAVDVESGRVGNEVLEAEKSDM